MEQSAGRLDQSGRKREGRRPIMDYFSAILGGE
jgi:hypothetical protein